MYKSASPLRRKKLRDLKQAADRGTGAREKVARSLRRRTTKYLYTSREIPGATQTLKTCRPTNTYTHIRIYINCRPAGFHCSTNAVLKNERKLVYQ